MEEEKTKLKKPTTAYFAFMNDSRPAIKESVLAENSTLTGKDLMTAVATKLAEMWKNISVEEKEKWNEVAKVDKERYEKEKLARGVDSEEEEKQEATPILPIARVKKLMQVDPQVKTISKEAVLAVSKAAEMFLAAFVGDSVNVAKSFKKKTVTPQFFDLTARTHDRYEFLRSTYRADESDKPAVASSSKKRPLSDVTNAEGSTAKINTFFSSNKEVVDDPIEVE